MDRVAGRFGLGPLVSIGPARSPSEPRLAWAHTPAAPYRAPWPVRTTHTVRSRM
jgi:hypothetical protein